MSLSIKEVEHRGDFVAFWNRQFKVLIRWLCLCPTILILAYEAYHWLKFAKSPGLDTYKIAPPRLLGFLYNLTHWEGVNVLIYNFLQLPIFITMPLISSIIIYSVFQCVLAFYYLGLDCRKIFRKISGRSL